MRPAVYGDGVSYSNVLTSVAQPDSTDWPLPAHPTGHVSHSSPTFQTTELGPAVGPLHLLFPLPEHFPQMSLWLVPSSHSHLMSHVTLEVPSLARPPLSAHLTVSSPHFASFPAFYYFLVFFYLSVWLPVSPQLERILPENKNHMAL